LIKTAVGKVYTNYFEGVNVAQIVQWFELGGSLKMDDSVDSANILKQLAKIQGLMEKTGALGLGASEPDAVRASAAEFILEGLYAHRRISRNEEVGFTAGERKREAPEGNEGRRPPRKQFN
jgi:magnesium chelatase subunit I